MMKSYHVFVAPKVVPCITPFIPFPNLSKLPNIGKQFFPSLLTLQKGQETFKTPKMLASLNSSTRVNIYIYKYIHIDLIHFIYTNFFESKFEFVKGKPLVMIVLLAYRHFILYVNM